MGQTQIRDEQLTFRKLTVNQTTADDIEDIQDNGTSVRKIYDGGITDLPKQSCGRIYLANSMGIADNTETLVTFDTKSFDIQSEFDVVTNHNFTATKAGKYLVIASLCFYNMPDNSTCVVDFWKNGTLYSRSEAISGPNESPRVKAVDIITCAANDYIDVRAIQISGASRTIWGDPGNSTFFNVYKIM